MATEITPTMLDKNDSFAKAARRSRLFDPSNRPQSLGSDGPIKTKASKKLHESPIS